MVQMERFICSVLYIFLPILLTVVWGEYLNSLFWAETPDARTIMWLHAGLLVPLFSIGALLLNAFLDSKRVVVREKERPMVMIFAQMIVFVFSGFWVGMLLIFDVLLREQMPIFAPGWEPAGVGTLLDYWPQIVIFCYTAVALTLRIISYFKSSFLPGLFVHLLSFMIPALLLSTLFLGYYAGMVRG